MSKVFPNALVAVSTTHGQTMKIAIALAEAMRLAGVDVTLLRLDATRNLHPRDYDAVVLGGSLHHGSFQRDLVAWVKENEPDLNRRPNAFFSVSLSAADDTPKARDAVAHCIERFYKKTGWRPGRTSSFAGALRYTRYTFPTKVLMRWMMRRSGHPTDTSRDFEYTDWSDVERAGREFAALAQSDPMPDASLLRNGAPA